MPLHPPIPSHLHLAKTPLPDPGPALAVFAHDLAELGAWLLAASGATLMTVTLGADERDAVTPIMLWDRRLTPDFGLTRAIAAPDYRFRAVVRAAGDAADALFEALCPRWPGATPPTGLGAVTDGRGLGFCPDDPCPLVTGWMARQTRDPARLTCLLPFVDAPWLGLARARR